MIFKASGVAACDLALHLLACPAGDVNRAVVEVAVRLGLLDHAGEPVLTESVYKFTVGEGFSKVTVIHVSRAHGSC